jgi:Carboxypeptidase regulatory-like domain
MRKAILLICVVQLLVAGSLWAQATTGSIVGHVSDPSKGLVAGAKVSALNQDTGVHYEAETNRDGDYVISNVPPGGYTVTVEKQGFAKAAIHDVLLVIDQKQLLNFDLTLGSVSESVTVTSAPTLLQTQSSETGDVIQSQEILDLPLLGRTFYGLTQLTAGVIGVGGSINSFNFSVNGSREYANSIQIDGIESTTNRTQDITATPSVDSVEEFKVATSAFSAEYGRSAGGEVSIQTKSGSNQFHGDAYEFFQPNFLAARAYSFGGPKPPAPILKQHNYGGTLGGPIKKNKLFFFASYEGTKNTSAYSYLNSTPPLNQIKVLPDGSVDLSKLLDPFSGTPVQIFDPNVNFACKGNFGPTCHPVQFTNGIIPANRVSKAGLNTLLNFFAMPNLPGTGNGWFNNFQVDSPNRFNQKQADGRADYNISSKDRLSVIFHYNDSDNVIQTPYYGHTVVPSADDADQGNNQTSSAQQYEASETHLFSTRFLNEFRFGYIRYNLSQFSPIGSADLSGKYGMGNIFVPGFPATGGYPDIFLYSGYLTGGSSYKPFLFKDRNFQIADNVILSGIGKHEFKFGGDFRRLNSYPNFSIFPTGFQYYQAGYSGLSATSDPTAAPNYANWYPYGGGSEIADLILGIPNSVDIGLQLTKPHTQSWEMDYYAQDTYRLTRKLTLNYGIRYEYQAPYTEANNYISNYDPNKDVFLLAGRGGNSAGLLNSRWNDFAPRVGFAYMVTPKTVFRAGFGIFYTPENDGREDVLTKNYPFAELNIYKNNPYVGGPYQYLLDTGVVRNTTINIPAGAGSIPSSSVPNGPTVTSYSANPNMKTGYSENFNVAVQRELSSNFTVEAAFVGSRNHKLSYLVGNINFDPITLSSTAVTPNLGKIQYLTDTGWGSCNSLQVKLTKRVSRNLNFLANYTYGHNLDNGAAPFNLGQNSNFPQNPNNLKAEIASSDSDIRHNFVFSGSYQLPIGRGQAFFSNWGRVHEMVLGGWQINGILFMRTGTPVNVVRGASLNSCPGVRPNLVQSVSGPRTLSKFFNTAAFDSSPFNGNLACAPGTAGRNLIVGLGYVNVDFSLFKTIAFTERFKLQLRLESFNLSNSPHFSNPDGVQSDGTFGQITRTYGPGLNQGMRSMQIAGKFIF